MNFQRLPADLADNFRTNPEEWRPFVYGCHAMVGTRIGSRETCVATLNSSPFILVQISHQILGLLTEGGEPINDGSYLVTWGDETSNYTSAAIPADLLFGSTRSGYLQSLAFPVYYGGNSAITFEITNMIDRTNEPTDLFRVDFALHGWMYWGTKAQPR